MKLKLTDAAHSGNSIFLEMESMDKVVSEMGSVDEFKCLVSSDFVSNINEIFKYNTCSR